MSTRGVIARTKGDGFTGRYHHWDSYPEGLGETLYQWAQRMPLEQMLHLLLDEHPVGWSTIVGTDPDLLPGFVDSTNPERRCVVCGMRIWEHYRQYYGIDGRPPLPEKFAHIPQNVYLLTDHPPKPEKFPTDSRPQCYCHGERHEPPHEAVTEKNAAAMGCEYAYVFDEKARVMHILSSYCKDGHKMIGMFGMGDKEAVWRLMTTVALDGPEPDWRSLSNELRKPLSTFHSL